MGPVLNNLPLLFYDQEYTEIYPIAMIQFLSEDSQWSVPKAVLGSDTPESVANLYIFTAQ